MEKPLLADDMILYMREPKDSTKILLKFVEFGKIAGYIINSQKSIMFLFPNNFMVEKFYKQINKNLQISLNKVIQESKESL